MLNGSKRVEETIVKEAVEMGYRHYAVFNKYGCDWQIGTKIADVIREGLVKREDLFITATLAPNKHQSYQVVPALRGTLRNLGMDYIDLFLINSPFAFRTEQEPIDYLETWEGMEKAKFLGLAKSIGISSFELNQLDRLLANCKVKPVVHLLHVDPTETKEMLVSRCQLSSIVVLAYTYALDVISTSLKMSQSVRVFKKFLMELNRKYQKENSQLAYRYLIDRGLVPLSQAFNKTQLLNNLDVFNFQLTAEEVDTLNSFNNFSAKANRPVQNNTSVRQKKYQS